MNKTEFTALVWRYYHRRKRDFPWRRDVSPYAVLVSEIMLQQTQASRVVGKFASFINTFPDIQTLAAVTQADVVAEWSGLGYNRRARYLHVIAQKSMLAHQGAVPKKLDDLVALPGIGYNTAAAIMAYAYNQPHPFIETNIRTTYLHHFFKGNQIVSDAEIMPIVALTLDTKNPREWYWALMDYGAHLKRKHGARNRRSKQYRKQPTFEGSERQLRGFVVKQLIEGAKTLAALRAQVDDDRFDTVINTLQADQLVIVQGERIALRQ